MRDKQKKKVSDATYYAANREEILARQAAHVAANPEKISVKNAAYRANNVEEIKAKRDAWRAANREEIKAYNKAYNAAHAEEIKAKRIANREKIRATQEAYQSSGRATARCRMRDYGLSSGAFHLMLLMQRNTCGICKEVFSKPPNVDHDHKTGEIRGLLCGRCNKGLGHFRDSTGLLDNAKDYLQGKL